MKRILNISILVVLCGLMLGSKALRAQTDVQFSQFYANRLFYNPAAIQDDGLLRVSLTDREQYWGKDLPTRPSYRLLNGSYFFDEQNMGIALNVHQWNANIENNLLFNLAYMYRLQVGQDAYINFGLNIGAQHRFLSQGYLPSGEIFVPDAEKFNPNMDMGLGIEFHTTSILAGVSVQHLPIKIGDNPTFTALHSYYYFGYNFFLDENWSLFPIVAVRMAERQTNVDVSMRAVFKDILHFGLAYRLDALVGMAGVSLGKNFSLSYAFDWNIGRTNRLYKPSHELILTFRADFKKPDRPLLHIY